MWIGDLGELRECASVWTEVVHPCAFVGVPCGLRFVFAFDYDVETRGVSLFSRE